MNVEREIKLTNKEIASSADEIARQKEVIEDLQQKQANTHLAETKLLLLIEVFRNACLRRDILIAAHRARSAFEKSARSRAGAGDSTVHIGGAQRQNL